MTTSIPSTSPQLALRRSPLLLVLLAACSGQAVTPVPAAAPVSPPTMPSATPAPAASVAPPKVLVGDYEPAVQVGNTAPLGKPANVPFAQYLVAIHRRVHPIFTDQLLASWANLPPSHPLNQELRADVEIVIDHRTGQLVKIGVVRPSGVSAFDLAVLDAVRRAAPFGPAPEIIASPDGNVYVQWEFHRDPRDACSVRRARPYRLRTSPGTRPAAGQGAADGYQTNLFRQMAHSWQDAADGRLVSTPPQTALLERHCRAGLGLDGAPPQTPQSGPQPRLRSRMARWVQLDRFQPARLRPRCAIIAPD
jgi:TonB family protein